MRPLRLALAAVAVALAAGSVLLAHDVRAWRATFRRDDLRFAAAPAAPVSWRASTVLPGGAAGRLLAVGDDRAYRAAVRLFALSYRSGLGFDNGFSERRLRAAAEAALAGPAQSHDARRASQALDLLGLLAFADASSASGGAGAADRALADLRNAVGLDPDNDDAKANLELLLRLLQPHGARPGQSATAGPRATGRRGAGSGTPGRGY